MCKLYHEYPDHVKISLWSRWGLNALVESGKTKDCYIIADDNTIMGRDYE